MHEKTIAQQLFDEQLISETSHQKINLYRGSKNFSLHAYIKLFLYLGVTLIASGLSILIYKNIETIGHAAIVIIIGLFSTACFTYCTLKKNNFSFEKVEAPNIWFDYVLLLGALLLLTLIGYLQFQFHLFGDQWGLATFIPFIILFFAAYYFDHIGVLSMAIVLFASWLGIAVTPVELFRNNDFESSRFIYTGVALSLLLATVAWLTNKFEFKKHLTFTYLNFALHIGFVASLCGLFTLNMDWLWCIVMALFFIAAFKYAFAQKSFYVLLISVLYTYIGLSYIIIQIGQLITNGTSLAYLMLIYFILTAIMLIKYLREFKKEMQTL